MEQELNQIIEKKVNLVFENLKSIEKIKEMQQVYNKSIKKYLHQGEIIIKKEITDHQFNLKFWVTVRDKEKIGPN